MLNNVFNPLKMIWFCYNTHFPYTPARVYSGLVFSRLKGSITYLENIMVLQRNKFIVTVTDRSWYQPKKFTDFIAIM